MAEKMIKCYVKGPKGLWVGNLQHHDGDEVELPENTVISKRARGNLYATGEYEGMQAAEKASAKAAEAEETKTPKVEVKKFNKPSPPKGAGSKES